MLCIRRANPGNPNRNHKAVNDRARPMRERDRG
jgi:hypothetical protein